MKGKAGGGGKTVAVFCCVFCVCAFAFVTFCVHACAQACHCADVKNGVLVAVLFCAFVCVLVNTFIFCGGNVVEREDAEDGGEEAGNEKGNANGNWKGGGFVAVVAVVVFCVAGRKGEGGGNGKG